jgi:hypothetical protein
LKATTHPNLGAAMAEILALPPDVDRGAMFAAAVGARRNSRFLSKAKLWLKGKQCAFWLFPSLEMNEDFWLPVCRRNEDHHLHLAHLGSFERFDVLAVQHAAIFKFDRRMSTMFVRLVKDAQRRPKHRRELEAMLAELAAVA